MTVTYGFYNSVSGDRTYNALQVSSLFDGILRDGVFASVGAALLVTGGSGLVVVVGSGRAWFNKTWTYNDANLNLNIDSPDLFNPRIDVVVLEVNEDTPVRANSIKIVKGTPSASPVAPTLTNTSVIHQYPLAHVSVPVGTTTFLGSSLITNKVGTTACPFVTGILSVVTVDDLLTQWNAEFDIWFDAMKDQLTTDAAGNLQTQIDTIKSHNEVRLSRIDYSWPDIYSEEDAVFAGYSQSYKDLRLVTRMKSRLQYTSGNVSTGETLYLYLNYLTSGYVNTGNASTFAFVMPPISYDHVSNPNYRTMLDITIFDYTLTNSYKWVKATSYFYSPTSVAPLTNIYTYYGYIRTTAAITAVELSNFDRTGAPRPARGIAVDGTVFDLYGLR